MRTIISVLFVAIVLMMSVPALAHDEPDALPMGDTNPPVNNTVEAFQLHFAVQCADGTTCVNVKVTANYAITATHTCQNTLNNKFGALLLPNALKRLLATHHLTVCSQYIGFAE